MHALIAAAAPVLLPSSSSVLRPRFGQFPLILLGVTLIWLVLMRVGLPRFGRWATAAALGAIGLLILSWLPRIAVRTWGKPVLTPFFYQWVVLPSTVVQVFILLTLALAPIWLPLGLWAKRRRKRDSSASTATSTSTDTDTDTPSRRDVLGALAWSVPAASLALAGYGVAVGAQGATVRRLRLKLPGLPASLRGLRIGQITDVHVAQDLTPMRQLERGCDLLAGEGLDLVLSTGDLCDNPRLLGEVLRLVSQVPARLGHFGCLGNHELYLGLPHVRRSHDRSKVQLLEDRCVRLGELTLAGLSYPHTGSPRLSHVAVPPLLDQALRDRQSGTATILLAHHPHIVQDVAGRDIDLMLSGHTHGGQVGVGERSLIEPAYGFVRGLYRPDQTGAARTHLFVSSGLGHWLPWRVGCPPEVVVIELV